MSRSSDMSTDTIEDCKDTKKKKSSRKSSKTAKSKSKSKAKSKSTKSKKTKSKSAKSKKDNTLENSESDDPFEDNHYSDVSDSEDWGEVEAAGVAIKESPKAKKKKSTKTKKSAKSTKSSKYTLTNKRKIINYQDDPLKLVTAAGVMFYKIQNKKMQLLMISKKGKLEDIGGKIDQIDDTIEEAAAREVEEETNGKIKAKNIIDRLRKSQSVYVKGSKYVIFIVEANSSEKALDKDDFGEYEKHDNIRRDIIWVAKEKAFSPTFIRGKLNYRIKSKSLQTKLEGITKSKKFSKRLF